mgnify:CR=1 FL=1
METIKLNNGMEMPILGLGTMRVKNLHEIIPAAIEAGYRLIDTAANYDNEQEVGAAIKASGIDRGQLFITSKMQILSHGENTRKAVENSLRNLSVDYLDLYLIHQPYGDIYGEWRELEKLCKEGKIRAIGVSNFEPFRLMDLILHNEIVPAVNQIEVHPWCQMQKEHDFHKANGIRTEAWAPFAENKNNLFTQPVLQQIAKEHGKSVPQVILRWVTQRGIIAIPRTTDVAHAKANLEIFDIRLTDEEMELIETMDMGKTQFLDHLDPEIVKLLSTVVANPIEVGSARPSHDEWDKQRKKMNA